MMLRYNFDYGSLEESTLLELIQLVPLIYCLIVCKSKEEVILLVTAMIPTLLV